MEDTAEERRPLVLASGVFDLVHYGHVYFLEQAKKTGGDNARLTVVVARDRMVEKTKGKPPILHEEQRRMIVASLKPVDEAILGHEEFDMTLMLREIRPDVVAVGYDQKQIENEVRSVVARKGLGIRVVRIGKFLASELDSSSKIRRKILGQHQTALPVPK
ncbi:FAD synthase [Candidatus Bathyarchaeota archaeon]|jgi:FAD synthetase|nr:FAD synthase [Candidatus Bathyarchaeota archaeon]